MNVEKEICDLAQEQHKPVVQEISELRAELLQPKEQVGADIARVRNEMSAGQLAMQQDLNNMQPRIVYSNSVM